MAARRSASIASDGRRASSARCWARSCCWPWSGCSPARAASPQMEPLAVPFEGKRVDPAVEIKGIIGPADSSRTNNALAAAEPLQRCRNRLAGRWRLLGDRLGEQAELVAQGVHLIDQANDRLDRVVIEADVIDELGQ